MLEMFIQHLLGNVIYFFIIGFFLLVVLVPSQIKGSLEEPYTFKRILCTYLKLYSIAFVIDMFTFYIFSEQIREGSVLLIFFLVCFYAGYKHTVAKDKAKTERYSYGSKD